MKLKKLNAQEFCKLEHERYKCYFTLVDRNIGGKTANGLSFKDLQYTSIRSEMLTSKSARIIGEMFLNISKLLE